MREKIVDGGDREMAGELPFGGDVPPANAGAFDDPFVARVEASLEVGVGQHCFGRVDPERRNPRRRAHDLAARDVSAHDVNRDATASAKACVESALPFAASSAVRAPAA